jgi:hypothetical protein
MLRRLASCGLIAAALLWAPRVAEARQDSELAYPYEQVWGAAVRLLRVDYGFPIRDRDEAIGFVLFDYQEHGRSVQGSLEIIRTAEEGLPGVRVVLQIPSMPSYIERMLLDRLARKLREDFGVPAPPPSPAPPPEPPQAGDEGDEGAPPAPGQDEAPSATPPGQGGRR